MKMTSRIGNNILREKGFTFFEVMITVVILAVGLTGIYRAFLISLNYQKYTLTRLHILNFLSDEFSRFENSVIAESGAPFSSSGDLVLPLDSRSKFYIERRYDFLAGHLEGLAAVELRLRWDQDKKAQTFTRSSLVYVQD